MTNRRNTICAITLAAAMLFGSVCASADNMLQNGDFEGVDGALYDETDTYLAGWYKADKANLVTDGSNHYFQNNSGDTAWLAFRGDTMTQLPTRDKVYKLSYDYKHPDGTKLPFRFNSGAASATALVDWYFTNQRDPRDDEWHRHHLFLYNYTQRNANATRIGGNASAAISGAYALDNVVLEEAQNEIVFSDSLDTAGTWTEVAGKGAVEPYLEISVLQYKAERIDAITSLADALVDAETGERSVHAQIHYLSPESDVAVKAFAAVYKEENGVSSLQTLYLSDDVLTTAPMTSLSFRNIKVPAATEGTYKVKVMLWGSFATATPLMTAAVISD